MPYSYDYPRPALAADITVFRPASQSLELLLVERGEGPFEGHWATPGGFVEIDETVSNAAQRELREETGLVPDHMHQFDVFSTPDRDPRGRVVSNGYWTLIPRGPSAQAASDARATAWHEIDALPPLAFDHDEIVATALETLRHRARSGPVGLQILQSREPFDWTDVAEIHELILQRSIDRDALTQAYTRSGSVVETDEGLRCRAKPFAEAMQSGIDHW